MNTVLRLFIVVDLLIAISNERAQRELPIDMAFAVNANPFKIVPHLVVVGQ